MKDGCITIKYNFLLKITATQAPSQHPKTKNDFHCTLETNSNDRKLLTMQTRPHAQTSANELSF